MDTNETDGEKAKQQLHNNAASNIEQVLVATPHKAAAIRHLPSITKTIKVRRTRHAGHCWRSRDELISDVLLWTPLHGRAKAVWPARTYIQQLCEDTGCNHEDLPEAMNDRDAWRVRVTDIRANGMTKWLYDEYCSHCICPVAWGCRIHWLHLCNECPDMTLNSLMVGSQ